MQWRRFITLAGQSALDTVLPARCLICDAMVAMPGQLCPPCFRKTKFVTDPCCHRCGRPFEHDGQGGRAMICTRCAAHPPPWRQARAALWYDDHSRRIILPFKHGDRVETAAALAWHMARTGAALLQDADCIVAVPLHRRRLLKRRYNQSALLAQALARLSGRPAIPDALRRIHATPPLQGMGPALRAATVAGAFSVEPSRLGSIQGQRVLLVDDVLTTGATAEACVRTLLTAGASQVDLLVAACVPDRILD